MLTKSIITGVLLASLGGGAYYFGEAPLHVFLNDRLNKLRVKKQVIPVEAKPFSVKKKSIDTESAPFIEYTFFKSLAASDTKKYIGLKRAVPVRATPVVSKIRKPAISIKQSIPSPKIRHALPDTLLNAKENSQQQEYIVQVSSFRELAGAKALRNHLSINGYNSFLQEVAIPDNGVWYRVYLGRYPDKEKALLAAESAKINERLSAVVHQAG